MKYIVDNRHREFFAKNGWIEFEEIFPISATGKLLEAARGVVKSRTRVKNPDVLLHGHDIWRENSVVKNATCSRTLAEIASELTETKPLRLSYDQLLEQRQTPNSLEQICSLQGTVCGLLIALQDGDEEHLLSKRGNGLFLSTTTELPKLSEGYFLLIVYSVVNARYISVESDPHTNYLKRFGYSFGDRLLDKHHPVLFR